MTTHYCGICGNSVLRQMAGDDSKWECLSCHSKDVPLSMYPKGKIIFDGALYENGRLIARGQRLDNMNVGSNLDANRLKPVPVYAITLVPLSGVRSFNTYLAYMRDTGRNICNSMGESDAEVFVKYPRYS